MIRYIIDPFTDLIQDTGSGPHDLDELKVILSGLLDKGMSREDLIELIMKSFGITEPEARKLINYALGWDNEEPEPEDDCEDGPSPF